MCSGLIEVGFSWFSEASGLNKPLKARVRGQHLPLALMSREFVANSGETFCLANLTFLGHKRATSEFSYFFLTFDKPKKSNS